MKPDTPRCNFFRHGAAFREYMRKRGEPDSDIPCRRCADGYRQVNPEDQGKFYGARGE